MRIETEHIYKLVKKYGGVLTDDRHFMDDVDKLLETAHNSDYAKCHKEELENIICDIESAIYANEVTRKSILEKSLYSVKCYIETHFARSQTRGRPRKEKEGERHQVFKCKNDLLYWYSGRSGYMGRFLSTR